MSSAASLEGAAAVSVFRGAGFWIVSDEVAFFLRGDEVAESQDISVSTEMEESESVEYEMFRKSSSSAWGGLIFFIFLRDVRVTFLEGRSVPSSEEGAETTWSKD